MEALMGPDRESETVTVASKSDSPETKTRVTTTKWTGRTGLKERRAYIVLVLISVFLSLAGFFAGIHEIKSNNHKFCQIINAALAVPVAKPANPKIHQSRERAYESYIRVVRLGRDLGCIR